MPTKSNLLPKCIVCDLTPPNGIREGIFIGKKYLCLACEKKIARLTTSDEDYSFYFNKIKKVWL